MTGETVRQSMTTVQDMSMRASWEFRFAVLYKLSDNSLLCEVSPLRATTTTPSGSGALRGVQPFSRKQVLACYAIDMAKTAPANALGYFSPLAASQHCLLTTYKKVGTPVATPVYLVVDGNVAYFRTYDASGKAKRLRHTSRVELQSCDSRGKTKDGETVVALATLLEGGEAQHAAALLNRRHPLALGIVVPRIHKLRGWKTQHYRLDAPCGPGRPSTSAPSPG
jgi:uncharacterized protein